MFSDVLMLLIPWALAAGAFCLGTCMHLEPKRSKTLALIAWALLLSISIPSFNEMLDFYDEFSEVIPRVLTPTMTLLYAAMGLVGVAWMNDGPKAIGSNDRLPKPTRRFGKTFLAFLVILSFTILTIEASGRLYTRFGIPAAWTNFPDGRGAMSQTNGNSCGPVAVAMLLNYHGIVVSEGECSYHSFMSLLGTDTHSLKKAAHKLGQRLNWFSTLSTCTLQDCKAYGRPCVAVVRHPIYGSHAIFVQRFEDDECIIIDPLEGQPKTISAEQLESMWEGTCISLYRTELP